MVRHPVAQTGEFVSFSWVAEIGEVGEDPVGSLPLGVDIAGVDRSYERSSPSRVPDTFFQVPEPRSGLTQDVAPGCQDNRRFVGCQ